MLDNDGKYIIAIDAGGTMTDCVLFSEDGSFSVGKSLTNREDESASYLEAVGDAAGYSGITTTEAHNEASVCLYTGTSILNTILTGTGSKVGLIVTRGFENILVTEGGLTWIGESQEHILHQQLRRHTTPLVDPRMVIGVSERIVGPNLYPGRKLVMGEVAIPLNRAEVKAATERLLAAGAEVIGILFLNCYINPVHEFEAKAIVEEVAHAKKHDIPVITSYEVAPVMKEHNRVKSLVFQAYAAEKVRHALTEVEGAARAEGFAGRLLTLLSYGGAVGVDYPRLYETVISGPIGGITGAQVVAKTLDIRNVVTADLGGTSFDVGLLIDQMIQVRRHADFARHRLATSMVAIDAIGAGAGSEISVDEYKRIHVGPRSAGQKIGVCYEHPELTITDINVALGYVDPEYFLGGKVKLDREAVLDALKKRVAEPLGMDVYAAGEGVLAVAHAQMRDHLKTMLMSKGYDPTEFTIICYGGAGPVHMNGFTEGMGLAEVLTVPWAAGFSAYGAGCAEYYHRYEKSHPEAIPLSLSDERKLEIGQGIDKAWRELEEKAREELAAENVDLSGLFFRYGVFARYAGQLESFDTPLDFGKVTSAADVDRIVSGFEKVYTEMYPVGARFPEGGYAVSEVYLHAVVPKPSPRLEEHPLRDERPDEAAHVGTREVFREGKWHTFDVWQMDELGAGNVVRGPSIIRDPMTTVIIPPDFEVAFDKWLVMHYQPART